MTSNYCYLWLLFISPFIPLDAFSSTTRTNSLLKGTREFAFLVILVVKFDRSFQQVLSSTVHQYSTQSSRNEKSGDMPQTDQVFTPKRPWTLRPYFRGVWTFTVACNVIQTAEKTGKKSPRIAPITTQQEKHQSVRSSQRKHLCKILKCCLLCYQIDRFLSFLRHVCVR